MFCGASSSRPPLDPDVRRCAGHQEGAGGATTSSEIDGARRSAIRTRSISQAARPLEINLVRGQRPNDRVSPCGCAVDAIDPASRSRGAGDQTSIPASQQWARIDIARFSAGAGGGTDHRMEVEAADPIDSARRGRSKPRPPPARAVRRAEIAVAPGDVVAVDCLLTYPHSCRIIHPSCLAASLFLSPSRPNFSPTTS